MSHHKTSLSDFSFFYVSRTLLHADKLQLNVNLAESSVMRIVEYKHSTPRVCHVMNSPVSAVIQGLRGDKGEAGSPGLPGFSGPKGPAVSTRLYKFYYQSINCNSHIQPSVGNINFYLDFAGPTWSNWPRRKTSKLLMTKIKYNYCNCGFLAHIQYVRCLVGDARQSW